MIMMVASETFPAQIRQLRLQARLTQAELARRADVSRRTIIRWESAIVSPWIPELHKVLTALGVPEIDQAQVLSQITAPRAVQCCRDSETHTTYLLAKFLWSMRQRSGLSARSLARRVEVNASTIVRWESGQLLPSAEVVERLFEVLDVRELEREALGQMKQVRFLSEQPNPESLAAELSEICSDWDEWKYVLFDLRFTTFIERCKNSKQPEVIAVLAQAHAAYAEILAECSRNTDALKQVQIVLDMAQEGFMLPKATVHNATMVGASCYFHAGLRSAQRGLALLETLANAALTSEHLSRRLSLYAFVYASIGREARAIECAKEALSLVRSKPHVAHRRRCDLAEVFYRLQRYGEALETMPQIAASAPSAMARECSLLARILRSCGRSSDASHWAGIATELTGTYHLHPLFRTPER